MRILLILFFLPKFGVTQTNFHYNELNQKMGLSESTTSYVFTDSNRFTWVGTRNGLNRFDGKNVEVYYPKLNNGEVDPNLSSKVFEDSKGRLWFSTVNGLHFYNPSIDSLENVDFLDVKQAGNSKNIHLFHLDTKDSLWISAQGWLYKVSIHSKKVTRKHSYSSDWCYPIVSSITGEVKGITRPLLREGAGIEILSYCPNGQIKQKSYFTNKSLNDSDSKFILFFQIENDTCWWLPSDKGLIKFNPEDPTKYKMFMPKIGNKVNQFQFTDVKAWGDDKLWLSSWGQGLFLFNKTTEEFISQDSVINLNGNFVDINRIDNLHISSDYLWISIWGQGLFYSKLSQKKFNQVLFQKPGFPPKYQPALTILEDSSYGNIWSGTNESGIIVPKGKDAVNLDWLFPNFNSFQNIPTSYLKDWNNNIWISSFSNLSLWDSKTNEIKTISEDPLGFRNIVRLDSNCLLLLSTNEVFMVSDNNNNNEYFFDKEKPVLTFRDVYWLYKADSNKILISDGINTLFIYIYENQELELLKTLEQVGYVNGVTKSNNFLWLASNKGLFKMSLIDYEVESIKDNNSLLGESFNSIFADDADKIWLSSNNGIFQYEEKFNRVVHFTESDGQFDTQYNLRSGYQNSDGYIFFGNNKGIITFHPKEINLNQQEPKIHITNLTINDNDTLQAKDILVAKQKTFPYAQNTLSFTFAAIEYSAPEENQFKYFLEGYDKDTVDNGTEGFARYPNLPAGDYTLNVWGSNSDDVWTKDPKQLAITILPPWYQTWWFRTLVALGIGGIIYAIYRYRIAQIQKEATYKQLVAETETDVLRLQMNPHFIFNSMNSISSYIMQKDLDNAHDFLARFARLMRNILNSSERQFHSIGEEIELLEQYMDIEKRRFKEPFQYKFRVANIQDTDEVLLPTMILQPFVENAIWHGIASKGSAGEIIIFFEIKDNQLVCGVSDNGIGRAAAKVIKNKGYESKAISITQKRLNLLKKEEGITPILQIVDLQIGTKIMIQIPLEYLD